MTPIDIKSLSPEELKELFLSWGEKAFRSKQTFAWIHEKLADSFSEMTDLPKSLKERLEKECVYTHLTIERVQESKLDGTRKYLFALGDGNYVESVWMRYHHGNSVCISSQVGCRMGCKFCASTLDGCVRSLTASEMLEQIYAITKDTGERVSNVVVMGMGEPLDNYDNLIRFLHLISREGGLHISQRNLTVSTCGIVPNMYRLAEEDLQITLALSLHATSQEKRLALMPVANKYPLDQVLEACRYYFEKTGRRLTFEYALVAGVNDSKEDARELANLVGGLNCHINLIPVNTVVESGFHEPTAAGVLKFKNRLENYGINVTIRREMGRDIDGACGQLRKRHSEEG